MTATYAAQAAPATTWALARLRRKPPIAGPMSSTPGRAVLLALAVLADEALNSTGYNGTRDDAVARLVNLAPSTVRSWLRTLVYAELAVRTDTHTFRIPEEAFG